MTSRLARLGSLFSVVLLICSVPAQSQSEPVPVQAPQQAAAQTSTGSINGTVVDGSRAVVSGAKVTLTAKDRSTIQETLTATNGSYTFANVPPGDFQVTVTAASFAPKTFAGILQAGQAFEAPPTVLGVGEANVVIQVGG